MSIGDKIRSARLEKRMTQSEVAENKITRNMLSAIESGKALPSLDTLYHIASKLDLPIAYLISDDIDSFSYSKNKLIYNIRDCFSRKQFSDCIKHINEIDGIDDELAYILAYSHFELGVSSSKNGAFISAEEHLNLAKQYSTKTVYDTHNIEYRIPLYMSFVKNVNAPLLDFNMGAFFDAMSDDTDFEFFKYVANDLEYPYTNPLFKKHAAAKIKIRERKYYEAIELLLEILQTKSEFEYNAYLMYGVYGDLDNCYKQIFDFENAYKYIGKRLSMLEGFNS